MRSYSRRDHPRVCGEQIEPTQKAKLTKGSSPRVRGTALTASTKSTFAGIIPACAGNREGERCLRKQKRDHPRVCGEQLKNHALSVSARGSSPRVRGTAHTVLTKTSIFRIIPACAGNRAHRLLCPCRPRDHPRVCGEQTPPGLHCQLPLGSSPRVRGTALMTRLFFPRVGIIPACAGNRPCMAPSACRYRDHPRVCGEQSTYNNNHFLIIGSSPRVRGTDLSCLLTRQAVGIIPACAGNSRKLCSSCGLLRDHPRVCGEQCDVFHTFPFRLGSSPRVRGTAFSTSSKRAPTGIIPACAGNSRPHRRTD